MHDTEQKFYIQLGLFLRKMREMQGLSQSDIANKIGVTFQQVQKYEAGLNRIPVYFLMKYANVLELCPSVFFKNDFPNAPCRILNPHIIRNKLSTVYDVLHDIESEITNR